MNNKTTTQNFKTGQQVYFHVTIPKGWVSQANLVSEDVNCLARGIIASTIRQDGKLFFRIKVLQVATKTPLTNPQVFPIVKKIVNTTVKRNVNQIHSDITAWMKQIYQGVHWSGMNSTQETEVRNRISKNRNYR